MEVREQYRVLADLFRYPNEQYKTNITKCASYLKTNYPDAYAELKPFEDWVNKTAIFEIEELFGRTFHIQAICYLDLGYVLFAEDYKRGEFLVQMKREQHEAGVDCGEELADNLPNVLLLMSQIADKEFLKEFAVRVMIPALDKMISEFEESRIALKDKVRLKKQKVVIMPDLQNRNIYQYALSAIRSVVAKDYEGVYYNDPIFQPTVGVDALNCNTGCSTPSSNEVLTKN